MNPGRNPPPFPYELIWEEIGKGRVTINDLRARYDEFEIRFEDFESPAPNLPQIDRAIFVEMADRLEIEAAAKDELAENTFLIAGWLLTPAYRKAIKGDRQSALSRMKQIALHARALDDLLGQIEPNLAGAMFGVRLVEPEVIASKSSMQFNLGAELHDLALVAERIYADASAIAKAGRQPDYVRDTAIWLLLEAVDRAGCPVGTSKGNRRRDEPHFTGAAAPFIEAFFKLVAPRTDLGLIVMAAVRLRREKRKSDKMG